MGEKIHIELKKNVTQMIGEVREDISEILNLPKENKRIIIYPGVIKHIKRKHPHAFKTYFHKIPEILQDPDYIGVSQNLRIEYIKHLKEPILVALKYDDANNIFVSSMYIIEEKTIEKRLESGRIMKLIEGNHYKGRKQKYRNKQRRR